MAEQPPPARHTLPQFAQQWGITPRQVYTLISQGCPYHRGDGEPYLDSAEVEAWLRSTGKTMQELVSDV